LGLNGALVLESFTVIPRHYAADQTIHSICDPLKVQKVFFFSCDIRRQDPENSPQSTGHSRPQPQWPRGRPDTREVWSFTQEVARNEISSPALYAGRVSLFSWVLL